MTLSESLQGSAFFLPTLAAALLTSVVLVNRRWAYLLGVQRLLALSVLATTALIFAHVIPAALGLLSRVSTLLVSLLILGMAWRLAPTTGGSPPTISAPDPPDTPAASEPPRSRVPSILIAVLAICIVLVYQVARLRLYGYQLPNFIDAVGFHLPGIATWIKTGTLWRVDQFLPGFATAQYPNNGDFLILSTILPWHDLTLVRLSMVPFFALMGVGTYALAVEVGASRAAATTFAAAGAAVPYISHYAFEGIPDLVTLSMFVIGLVFAMRYVRSGLTGDLTLGGLALGVSFGAKWYGVTSVAVTIGVYVLIWLLQRRPLRETARDTALVLVMVIAGGGIWLVRNVVESGNPIYPKAVTIFGVQLFAGSRNDVIDRYGYTIAHYLGQPSILQKYIYPGFKFAIGLIGAVIVAALLVVTIGALRRRSISAGRRRSTNREDRGRAFTLALVTVAIFAIYIVTPGTAYGPKNLPLGGYPTLRWLMPAVLVGLACSALAATQLGRWGVLLELAGLAGLLDGIRLGDELGTGFLVRVALVVAAAATLLALGRRAFPVLARRLIHRRAVAAGGTAVLTVVVAVGIWARQRSFDHQSYATYDPIFAWIVQHAPSGHRVGITGEATLDGLAPVLPMAGPRLGNRLAYVGDPVGHSVQLPASASSFRADLLRGRYDLLEIRLNYTGHTDEWARALGYRVVATSRRLALYAAPTFIPATVDNVRGRRS